MGRDINDCKAYAAYLKNTNDLDRSTSGGIFYALAKMMIENGGVVYGVTVDNDFNIKHCRVDSMDELNKIRRSKYAQSRIGAVYCQAKTDLENGIKVLFSGTPCQIAGLKGFLQKNYPGLYTVDIFCHGVPSNRLFKEHVKYIECSAQKQMDEFQFRNKDFGWRPVEVSYLFKGEVDKQYRSTFEDAYFRVFDKYISLRKCCYNCIFRGLESGADITIGDFWGIENWHPDFVNENKGISGVIVKTKNGDKLWEQIKDALIYIDSTVQKIGDYNFLIYRSIGQRRIREVFYEKYREHRKKFEVIDIGAIYEETIKKTGEIKVDVLGSYSLRACVYPILVYDYKIVQRVHWTGTSIMSAMSKAVDEGLMKTVHLKNEYRQNCIELDWRKGLIGALSAKDRGQYLVMDLLDDTLDELLLSDEQMIIKSEACEDYLEEYDLNIKKIIRMADCDRNEWNEACDRLIGIIDANYGFDNIVVVCNFLTEKHGNSKRLYYFDELDDIRKKNNELKYRYEYLISHMPGCKMVKNTAEENYTPENFRYGCKPTYYSGSYYRNMAHNIYMYVGDNIWK